MTSAVSGLIDSLTLLYGNMRKYLVIEKLFINITVDTKRPEVEVVSIKPEIDIIIKEVYKTDIDIEIPKIDIVIK